MSRLSRLHALLQWTILKSWNSPKAWYRLLFVGLALCSTGLLSHRLLYAQILPPLRYSSTSSTLVIGRPYLPLLPGEGPFVVDPSHAAAPKLYITLPALRTWAESIKQPDLIRDVGNGIWEIAVQIDVEDNAQLDLTCYTEIRMRTGVFVNHLPGKRVPRDTRFPGRVGTPVFKLT